MDRDEARQQQNDDREVFKIMPIKVIYSDCDKEKPIDLYAKHHYKLWCIKGDEYSKEMWYNLVLNSPDNEYQIHLRNNVYE
jgi:hypothetical protein